MNAVFGDRTPSPQTLQSHARITIRTEHLDLKWSHCSASADFISEYYAGVFAADRTTAQVNDLSHSISYLANELIENAVKFRADGDVELEAGVDDEDFLLRITNWIAPETSTRFQGLLSEITNGDPGELLIERIEANALENNGSGSGLGILTLMSDYGVRLSWEFLPEEPGDNRVFLKTLARLRLPQDKAQPTTAKRHHGN